MTVCILVHQLAAVPPTSCVPINMCTVHVCAGECVCMGAWRLEVNLGCHSSEVPSTLVLRDPISHSLATDPALLTAHRLAREFQAPTCVCLFNSVHMCVPIYHAAFFLFLLLSFLVKCILELEQRSLCLKGSTL